MRALITGARGQLGSDLLALLPDAAAFGSSELDVRDQAAVAEAVRTSRPDVVFNCAAYNPVDKAETEPETAMAVNAEGAANVARVCAEAGSRLVHYSTNFVFAGDKADAYSEDDDPGPLGAYARSKLEGERLVLAALPSALILRTAGLFGVRGSAVKGGSFPERMIARARSGDALRVVADQRLNPTFTGHLAAASVGYVRDGLEGVVHAVAQGCCSFADLARAALGLAGLDTRVDDVTSADINAAARRPLNGCLRSLRVEPLPPWQDGLAEWWRAFGK